MGSAPSHARCFKRTSPLSHEGPFGVGYGVAAFTQVGEDGVSWREVTPDEVAALAQRLHSEDPRMVGVAYTYNEPLVAWEYVRDCGRLVRTVVFHALLDSAAAEHGARRHLPHVCAGNC